MLPLPLFVIFNSIDVVVEPKSSSSGEILIVNPWTDMLTLIIPLPPFDDTAIVCE